MKPEMITCRMPQRQDFGIYTLNFSETKVKMIQSIIKLSHIPFILPIAILAY